MEHGALDVLDLAMHIHGEVHDDAEVQLAVIGIAVMANSRVTPDDRTQKYDIHQEE